MFLQLLLCCRSCGSFHNGFDVHVEISLELCCTLATEDWDLSSHFVQAVLEDSLGLSGGEGGAFVGGLPLQGVVKHIVDHWITLKSSPGVACVVSFCVHF